MNNSGSSSNFEQPLAEQNAPVQVKQWKKYILPLGAVLLLIIGLIAGTILVLQNQNILKKAAGSWSVQGTLGFSNCSGSQCTLTLGMSCEGMTASSFYCPGGLVNGRCFENEQGVGGFQRGQTVDLMSFTGGKTCGAIQVDWNAPGSASSTGNCGAATLINSEICSGSNPPPSDNTTPPPTLVSTPTPTPKAVCGETCNTNSDCGGSTVGGITVVCRENKCVNLQCSNQGGETIFGTRCDCINPHGCGAECGADIGLCDEGLSCTYKAQSQCNVGQRGVCVPRGIADAERGRMEDVPVYDGSYFQRRACGAGTGDSQNNYIYHASFPNHTFTKAEVMKYICNPNPPTPTPTVTPTPSPTPTPPSDDLVARCVDVRAYDLSWNSLTAQDLAKLKPGAKVRFSVRGNTSSGKLTQARFTLNGNVRSAVTAQKPGSTGEFYDELTVPNFATNQNTLTISVKAELYHSGLKRWF